MPQDVAPPAWWTDADQAELDLIAHDLFELTYVHHMNCDGCHRNAGGYCQDLRDVWAAVDEWKQRRSLYSKATYFRLEDIAHIQVRRLHDSDDM